MERIVVEGGVPLYGTVNISGAKNAVLPVIAGSLLADGFCQLNDIPHLADVETICEVLGFLGVHTNFRGHKLEIEASDLSQYEAPYECVRRMRASFLIMGPLLARMGRARMSLPGGCAIGSRPIDLHLKGFEALGADITIGHGYIEAKAKRLIGDRIYLDFPSVGATENIMMAATLAEGNTIIENSAEEPEIVDLANFLNAMGARIKGAGTKIVRIDGVDRLRGVQHTVIPDRVEAGSFMVAAAATGGNVLVNNVIEDHLKSVVAKLKEAGVEVIEESEGLRVIGPEVITPVDIKTLPYPGFPTDMQAQFMALMARSRGTSVITETVFENRFMHVDELNRMSANIKIEGHSAVVKGVSTLTGADVKATDLRAGAALVIAGLAAEGKTSVGCIHHIDRGYEDFVGKLQGLGARIVRVEE
ncbi:UDP-N-acetylglucosamine 1-carboxyvinyltransferase [Candidatus Formimonas warabiya]|uniref:UDP-N-acetylglucosamine 1-carboxyvinyltransferase n=1 Tax=Formimonas warabiya TaxID=1761012 RepID=A0A3G1KU82_FORW1|nr:UDP-N-acetylglucosamine 1-carboxyvinyltransferase [Candidatus Formimonas warabiya]ATW25974.1 UDP-N-acetylglucosamine 1-carboxyvinyltransferase [Candidatus Formimonas warabiya]